MTVPKLAVLVLSSSEGGRLQAGGRGHPSRTGQVDRTGIKGSFPEEAGLGRVSKSKELTAEARVDGENSRPRTYSQGLPRGKK